MKNTFQDLEIWKESLKMTVDVYQTFKTNKDYSFKDQIQRASVSVMNNIAEGFERQSEREFTKFLYYSKGSSGEVRSMLELAFDLKYIDNSQLQYLRHASTNLSVKIYRLIKYLENKS
jgi:four helix bundle protein